MALIGPGVRGGVIHLGVPNGQRFLPVPEFFTSPGSSAGSEMGIAHIELTTGSGVTLGDRSFRWDASGMPATELANFGANNRGLIYSYAYACNTFGTIVGSVRKPISSTTNGFLGYQAVRWNAAGTVVTELGHLGTSSIGQIDSRAFAVNSSGAAAGYANRYSGSTSLGPRGVRWNETTGIAEELGNLGVSSTGATSSSAYDINSAGTAVGYSIKVINGLNRGTRAVRWNAGTTTATELGSILGNGAVESDYAIAVNDQGTAVGYGYTGSNQSGTRYALRWDAGTSAVTILGNLGVDANGKTTSVVSAINNAGISVGTVDKYESGVFKGTRAVRWGAESSAPTELEVLGDPLEIRNSSANAINSSGIVVGSMNGFAAAWRTDGTAVVLRSLLSHSELSSWTELFTAVDISDTYWITGTGAYFAPGTTVTAGNSFLLDAVYAFGTPGDIDRNQVVDFDDLLSLAQNYETETDVGWDAGDFDRDGHVAFSDLLALAQHYQSNSEYSSVIPDNDFAADWLIARSLAPEPTLGALFSLPMAARRKRPNPRRA